MEKTDITGKTKIKSVRPKVPQFHVDHLSALLLPLPSLVGVSNSINLRLRVTSSHGLVLWAGGALKGAGQGAVLGGQGGAQGGQGGALQGAGQGGQGGQDFLMLGIQDGLVQVSTSSSHLLSSSRRP